MSYPFSFSLYPWFQFRIRLPALLHQPIQIPRQLRQLEFIKRRFLLLLIFLFLFAQRYFFVFRQVKLRLLLKIRQTD